MLFSCQLSLCRWCIHRPWAEHSHRGSPLFLCTLSASRGHHWRWAVDLASQWGCRGGRTRHRWLQTDAACRNVHLRPDPAPLASCPTHQTPHQPGTWGPSRGPTEQPVPQGSAVHPRGETCMLSPTRRDPLRRSRSQQQRSRILSERSLTIVRRACERTIHPSAAVPHSNRRAPNTRRSQTHHLTAQSHGEEVPLHGGQDGAEETRTKSMSRSIREQPAWAKRAQI